MVTEREVLGRVVVAIKDYNNAHPVTTPIKNVDINEHGDGITIRFYVREPMKLVLE